MAAVFSKLGFSLASKATCHTDSTLSGNASGRTPPPSTVKTSHSFGTRM